MGRPVVTSISPAAAIATNIAAAQSLPGASGSSVVLNGGLVTNGVAVLDVPRRVLITSAGNDSGITFTVTGTARPEQNGIKLVETVTGGNATTAQTTQDFATVTGIVASGATASTITVGTSATVSGPWVPWSMQQADQQIAVQGVVTGTATWEVEYTDDDVFALTTGVAPFPTPSVVPGISGLTGTGTGTLPMCVASRLTITAITATPTVKLTQRQQGI